MKSILVLVFSDLRNDARVRRQIQFIQNDYDVTVVCFNSNTKENLHFEFIRPTPLTKTRKGIAAALLLVKLYKNAWTVLYGYQDIAKKLSKEKFDLIIANDIETLPLAFRINANAKVLFDAHEYAPRHFENKRSWRIFFQGFNIWMCQRFIPRVSGMTTIGKGLAQEYENNFGVRPVVITNANDFHRIAPSAVLENKIRLIHHGIATRSRSMELMIDLMDLLDERFTLDLMLLTPGYASKNTAGYIEELKERAKDNSRINFIPPVKSSDVVETIRPYDMGLFVLPPVNFNYANTLPNKLFDFIQARLGIAIGPTPEMAEIVHTYKNGIVSEDFTPKGIAIKLNELTQEDVQTFKKNSCAAAETLNSETNAKIFRKLISKLLNP